MKKIKLSGEIITDEYAEYYGWLGIEKGFFCPEDLANALDEANGDDVEIELNSPGGILIAGTEMYSALRSYPGKTTVHITAQSASASTVLMMGADRITAECTSLICVHNPFGDSRGTADDMRHDAKELDNIKEAIINSYMARTKLTREELAKLMDKNMWIDAVKAAEYGLVDEVIEPKTGLSNIAASADELSFIPAKEDFENWKNDMLQKRSEGERQKYRAKLALKK